MANAQFNNAFAPNYAQGNVADDDADGNEGLAQGNAGQQDNANHGGRAHNDGGQELQEANPADNAPPANNNQGMQHRDRVVVISPYVMRLWADGHSITRDNVRRISQGFVPLVHPPISRWHRGLLMLLAEERRADLIKQWDELNEVEKVLGIDRM